MLLAVKKLVLPCGVAPRRICYLTPCSLIPAVSTKGFHARPVPWSGVEKMSRTDRAGCPMPPFSKENKVARRKQTRVLVRGTLHRCAKVGACSRRFSRPLCCARGNTCKRRTGPPQNMWCSSVLFCVGTCKSEIAQTGRQRISQDGIGRSQQDLAIRSLGSRVNPAFAPNTAVDGGD